MLPEFAIGLSPRVDINLQYHSPMVEINDNQKSIPIVHQPKPIVLQSPPLALMATLRDNIHAYTPHQCFYLSPFFINGKGIFPSGVYPPNKTLPETDLPA